jgi:hypothetical protein
MVLFEMWTEKAPFNGRADVNLAISIVDKGLRPSLPDETSPLALLIRQCWDQDPKRRPRFDTICTKFETLEVTFPGTEPTGAGVMIREIRQMDRIAQNAIVETAKAINEILDMRSSGKSSQEIQNMLTKCARDGDVSGMSQILTAYLEEADINGHDSLGVSPLHAAIESGQLVIVEFISKIKEADCNIRDSDGNTPLIAAVKHQQQRIVGYLVQRKQVNGDLQNGEGFNALHMVETLDAKWHQPMIMSLAMGRIENCEAVNIQGRKPFQDDPEMIALFKRKQKEYGSKR